MAESEEVRAWIALAQRDPRAWLYEADRLKRAADLVGSRFQGEANEWLKAAQLDLDAEGSDRAFQLGPTALMLIGYAIEVLAKGLIVATDSSDEAVKDISRSHITVALLEDAGVEFGSGEEFLVDQTLYHAVRWFGRYPVPHPRDGQRYADQVMATSGSIFSHPGAISTDHYRRACELFDRMREQLARSPGARRRPARFCAPSWRAVGGSAYARRRGQRAKKPRGA